MHPKISHRHITITIAITHILEPVPIHKLKAHHNHIPTKKEKGTIPTQINLKTVTITIATATIGITITVTLAHQLQVQIPIHQHLLIQTPKNSYSPKNYCLQNPIHHIQNCLVQKCKWFHAITSILSIILIITFIFQSSSSSTYTIPFTIT